MKLSLKQITRTKALSPRKEQGTVAEVAQDYAKCFDQLPPIVVFKVPDEKQFLLVDGFHRYRAAEILGLDEVEVDKKAGSMVEAREYALLANVKHGLLLTRADKRYVIEEFLKLYPERSNRWIADDLATTHHTVISIRNELEQVGNLPACEVLVGKDGKEYPRTIEQPKSGPEERAGEEEAEATSEEPGPEETVLAGPTLGIYELNKAYQVGCIEGMTGLPEASIDLVFADPPYNLGKKYGEVADDKMPSEKYFEWCAQWFLAARRILKPGGALYVMQYPGVAAQWTQQLKNMFTFRRWISWVYPSNVGHSPSNWSRSHRAILYYIKGEPAIFFEGEADPQPYKNPEDRRVKLLGKEGTTPYDWWQYNLVKNVSKEKVDWPNQLPEELLHRIIVTSCASDGIVCDPFIGSGTTAKAAQVAGRDWIGFDIQSEAIKVTNKRIGNVS